MSRITSIESFLAVRPAWVGVATAGDVLGMGPRELLHAGPPLRDPTNPPPVLVSSAAVACVYDGWSDDFDQAEALIRDSRVTFSPAQERGCALPLAFVASASTPLCVVQDANDGATLRYAPLSMLRGADSRMGGRDQSILSRMAQRDTVTAPTLRAVLAERGPLPLWPIAAKGLAAGDDLHGRTAAANSDLACWLRDRKALALAADVEASPMFFLTVWMAACSLMLSTVEGTQGSTLVTRAGGNGECFGIALAGAPDLWVTTAAEPPKGHLQPAAPDGAVVCGAIGDSAIIDMFGLGGQRLALAPEPREAFRGFVPVELKGVAEGLLTISHPMISPPWPVGLDAQLVQAHRQAPLVALSMIAADGRTGFLGRGVYQPPVSLFASAVEAMPRPALSSTN